ncbi:phospholipase D family protein [Montanilutibacter psychrotolerans]|uniref:Phospholipase D family protein n=1 Tax=Montanilutibacter psychrotolerans TaxID=1327343 RepID=A0A3M8SQL8_9GAMM|nr:phospholipase D family protein [Lysobacter psychrotolerans]RNF83628.1 phospholipase D family protein [Lysobacter psychrotolerans]
MNLFARVLAIVLATTLSACATLSPAQRDRAAAIAEAARPTQVDCDRHDACAQPSPLRELAARAFVESSEAAPRHYALILDRGRDALLARINLLRSATTAIDLQTYIFYEDDSGQLVLDELLAAARRGVRVRVLIDQLAALEHVDTLAALAGVHRNFELRVYNPMFNRARTSYPQYALAAACCWRKLNQRMHTKLLLVDGAVGVTGGRNYQDDYYDWDPEYNFRDRDLLVAGPAARTMEADFEQFWNDGRSVRVEHLTDVGRRLLDAGVPPVPAPHFARPRRAQTMREEASDAALVRQRLADHALPVGAVDYVTDGPSKHADDGGSGALASRSLRGLIESAHEEVLLQTPYLVLSKPAQQMFRDLHQRERAPRVVVSTNSLAATDAFIAYALSYKYKRRYLREFGFHIYEFKPFPRDVPMDIEKPAGELPEPPPVGSGNEHAAPVAGAKRAGRARRDRRSVYGNGTYRAPLSREYGALRYGSSGANRPVPLRRGGVRVGLHAKSLVIDERVGVIGTHNFDPRGDDYNTESAVVIADPDFARALAQSIRRDIAPANSWVIARRDKPPVFSGLEYSLSKASEQLPLFDLWPVRYATSYEFVPGPACPQPLPPNAPGFRACYRPVGDFPEVRLGLKGLTTRIFTAFGAGLAPIL